MTLLPLGLGASDWKLPRTQPHPQQGRRVYFQYSLRGNVPDFDVTAQHQRSLPLAAAAVFVRVL